MSRREALFASLLLASLGSIALFACSADGSAGAEPPPAPEDGGPKLGEFDAGDAEAAADVATLDVDVGPLQPCWVDDLCSTALPGALTLRAVWGAGDGVVWSVGSQGEDDGASARPGSVLRWDGSAWTTVHTTTKILSAIWGSSASDIWVGGGEGLFHGTATAGNSIVWSLDTTMSGRSIGSIWGRGPSDVWAVVTGGATPDDLGVYHYDGTAWTKDASVPALLGTGILTRVWGGPSDLFVGGGDDMCFEVCGSGPEVLHRALDTADAEWDHYNLWARFFTGVSAGAFFPPNTSYVLSTNDGVSRKIPGVPLVENSNAFVIGGPTLQGYDFTPRRLYGVDILRAVWGTSPSDVWLAGSYGQLRHWDGSRWRTVSTVVAGMEIQVGIVQNGFYGIWGTSSDDFWVVGRNVALHKKKQGTP